jgi:Domain of unknown function (DUF4062)/NACHT domain
MAKIYISSTYADLKEYRELVYRTLRQMRHDVIAMEDYVASDERPLQKCLADIERCDIYIGIFAMRYGHIPTEGNPQQKSITELEYDKAAELGIPRLVFLLHEKANWLPEFIDGSPLSKNDGGKIAQLRQKLQLERGVAYFSTQYELAYLVSVAVQQLFESKLKEMKYDGKIAHQHFTDHMRRYAGARSEQEALARYLPLRLQSTQLESEGKSASSLPIGTFNQCVKYSKMSVLIGEPGSGKTTLLLYQAQQLATEFLTNRDLPFPVYLPLSKFDGGNANTILEAVALENGLEYHELSDMWWNKQTKICLFLDGANESYHSTELVGAIEQLCERESLSYHSIVLTCRPGIFLNKLRSSKLDFNELFLLPLSDTEINSFLDRYNASSLSSILDIRLREVLQEPGILSAFAQSAYSLSLDEIPRNRGEIYELHLKHLFQIVNSEYDFNLVKSPVLADLAYLMVSDGQNYLERNDMLYDRIASHLEEIHQRYYRRRRIMPYDWSAEHLMDEMLLSSVIEEDKGHSRKVKFSKQYYHDYFLASYFILNDWNSPEIQNLIKTISPEIWIYPLLIMIGIKPEAGKLLDFLPVTAQEIASRLWFETRIPGSQAPRFIQSEYQSRYEQLVSRTYGSTSKKNYDYSLSLLRNSDPRERIKAVNMLSQNEVLAVDALLDAALDGHPLVRAAACYALLHLCEFFPQYNDIDQPLPPLIKLAEESISYTSYGGGNFRLGQLSLLQFNFPGDISISVNIEKIDFDPITAKCEFNFIYTPFILYAANLFEARQSVDWLELAVRCQWISYEAQSVVQKAKAKRLLDLLPQLQSRATEYSRMAKFLADDFGIPHSSTESISSSISTDERSFIHLRRLYGTANLSRMLYHHKRTYLTEKAARQSPVKVQQNIQNFDRGSVLGVNVESANLTSDEDISEPSKYIEVVSQQNFENLDGAVLAGIEIGVLHGSFQYLPIRLLINCQVNVENVCRSHIGCFHIRKVDEGIGGLRAVCQMNIEHFARSDMEGIAVSLS